MPSPVCGLGCVAQLGERIFTFLLKSGSLKGVRLGKAGWIWVVLCHFSRNLTLAAKSDGRMRWGVVWVLMGRSGGRKMEVC